MTAPSTPLEAIKRLTDLTGQLRDQVRILHQADADATQKRHAADMIEARAYLNATGSIPERTNLAKVAADQAELDALVAESLVRMVRARVRTIESEIEVGRSFSAILRAEVSTLAYRVDGA